MNMRKRTHGALLGPALLALCLAGPASGGPLHAQGITVPGANLRCLTGNPLHCLPEAMRPDEPHRAICAKCHDLWEQRTLADAARTCTNSGCHANPAQLGTFHLGLASERLTNCTTCHPAHDVRIVGGGANCSFCHGAGGSFPEALALKAISAPQGRYGSVEFEHLRHGSVTCATCHPPGPLHGVQAVTTLQDCRSCHHTGKALPNCQGCHTAAEVAFTRQLVAKLEIGAGEPGRPERLLPFDHGEHSTLRCETCHTGGLANAPANANCANCHDQHHRPGANCVTCHQVPSRDTHNRTAHLGCGGVGCHVNAPASLLETALPTRELCVTCHRDLHAHEVGRPCVACHILSPQRIGG